MPGDDGSLSPWRLGRSLSGTRVIGGDEPGMGPEGLGGLDCGHQCFRRGGRLGHSRGRETGPGACGGRGGRVQAKACRCDTFYVQSFAVLLKKNP